MCFFITVLPSFWLASALCPLPSSSLRWYLYSAASGGNCGRSAVEGGREVVVAEGGCQSQIMKPLSGQCGWDWQPKPRPLAKGTKRLATSDCRKLMVLELEAAPSLRFSSSCRVKVHFQCRLNCCPRWLILMSKQLKQ